MGIHGNRAQKLIFQFPNVPGPGVCRQHAEGTRRQTNLGALVTATGPSEQPACQQGHIFNSISQGRERDHDRGQPKEQIFPKTTLPHLVSQTAMSRPEHPDVHIPGLILTDAMDLALLQEPQQLRLHGWWHLADLVEQHRASVRRLQKADSIRARPRERAFSMTKELRLEQPFRKRSAIDCDKGPIGTGSVRVDRSREKLLSGSRFPLDHHRDRRLARLMCKLQSGHHQRCSGNQCRLNLVCLLPHR